MTQQSAAAEQQGKSGRQGKQRLKPRGRPWLPGVSGNPSGNVITKASKRAAELFDTLLADFGGDLTAVDRAMLEQACRLMVRSERVKDPDSAVRLSNASARLLMNLRKMRGKREPTPHVPLREQEYPEI